MPSVSSGRCAGPWGSRLARVLVGLTVYLALQSLGAWAASSSSIAASPASTTPSPTTPSASGARSEACQKPVYLTFDTGHMGVAPLIAEILQRHQVQVTFFAADEPTREGDGSLGSHWAPWWQARAQEGHAFASHTLDHVYWLADAPDGRFDVRPSAGPRKGQRLRWTAQDYCAEISRARERLQTLTGVSALPLFRAPGGKTSPALLRAAKACGYDHVGWSASGFLGDELPSDRHPNARLLQQALQRIRSGDILMAHLGIWSRQDPWAPAVLEPLILGLQQQGFCFRTLREHPQYRPWIARHGA